MFSVFAFLIYYFVVYAFFSPGSQTFFRLTMFGLFLACIVSSCMFHSGSRERFTVDAITPKKRIHRTTRPHQAKPIKTTAAFCSALD